MTSSRFPGKVLSPLCGRPVIAHVIDQAQKVMGADKIILVTSRNESDDPLAVYVETCLNTEVFRGELTNVVRRFQDCLKQSAHEWFVRVCGDSPVIDHALISLMLMQISRDVDIITNVAPRTFPSGQSVEVIRAAIFLELEASALEQDEQEHVTLYFYRRPEQYRIRNVLCSDQSVVQRRLVVDTVADLKSLEEIMTNDRDTISGYARLAKP